MVIILTWVFNFFLGVFGTALLASQISSGTSISFDQGVLHLNLHLQNLGLLLYVVFLVVYFWVVKKYLGKTIGSLLVNKLLGKK